MYSSQKVSVTALTPFSPAYDLTRPNIAAISSNLGTDVAFVGVTFAFTHKLHNLAELGQVVKMVKLA